MNLAAYGILFFEISMLLVQVIRLYEQPGDGMQVRYLILLVILVLHNLCKLFLPFEQLSFQEAQSATTKTITFLVTVYFGYFFYRAFELKHIRFFVPNRALLSMPLVFLFILPEFDEPFRAGIMPFLFSFCVIWCASTVLMRQLKDPAIRNTGVGKVHVVISVYIALICWSVVPFLSLVGDFKSWDFILANVGFIGMNVVYVKSSVSEIRKTYAEVELLRHKVLFINKHDEAYSRYKLTRKEMEVANLIIEGHASRRIADSMHISLHTVNKHISNIFRKVNVNSKRELIQKLDTNQTPI